MINDFSLNKWMIVVNKWGNKVKKEFVGLIVLFIFCHRNSRCYCTAMTYLRTKLHDTVLYCIELLYVCRSSMLSSWSHTVIQYDQQGKRKGEGRGARYNYRESISTTSITVYRHSLLHYPATVYFLIPYLDTLTSITFNWTEVAPKNSSFTCLEKKWSVWKKIQKGLLV